MGCLGIPKDGSPGDENTPVEREELVGNDKKSKYDAEQVALDYAHRGRNVVIVNPSTPVGPGDIKPSSNGQDNPRFRARQDTGVCRHGP